MLAILFSFTTIEFFFLQSYFLSYILKFLLKLHPCHRRKGSRFSRIVCCQILVFRLFIKPGIQERGTECGERGECSLGFQGISQRILGNVIILTFRGMLKKIPGNVEEDSGECSKRFRGMFQKIPGDVEEDSWECLKRFPGTFEKIPGNVRRDTGECSRRFRGMSVKIPRNVGKDCRGCSKKLNAL